jgi:hypothetical protein
LRSFGMGRLVVVVVVVVLELGMGRLLLGTA